jgi:crotonobetainyl-CoA:carnitine CoA-transferase CaiB-like acyl-CoA transferase
VRADRRAGRLRRPRPPVPDRRGAARRGRDAGGDGRVHARRARQRRDRRAPVHQDGLPAAGYPRVLTPERRPHATKDGLVHLFPYLPKHYAAVFAKAGRAGADGDPRYADQRAALRNSDALYRDIRAVAPAFTTDEGLTYCREEGIPASPVVTLEEMVGALPLATHPAAGPYRVIPPMARFHGRSAGLRRAAPLVGQHTDEVLAELGLPAPAGGGPVAAARD